MLDRQSTPAGAGTPHRTLADRLRAAPPMTVPEQVDLAVALAAALVVVHGSGAVHGALTPASVLLDEDGGGPVLTGFTGAGTGDGPADVAMATLAPEQTGRTGRPVDQRADLYGLGVLLYQVATGAPPFDDGDPLNLVHHVLARVPVAPAQRCAGVPAALSAIVMRLLEKEPDSRYQSAAGLEHDLRRLRELLAAGADADVSFRLGEHDFPVRLSAPQQLVGRQAEVGALVAALRDAERGACALVLVRGAPGVGKTSLVGELRPLVTAQGGWFVTGKSDQYRRDLATGVVTQAMRALGRQLLTEPDGELLRLRTRLRAAVGSNAGLLASVQPEIGLVLDTPAEAHAQNAPHATDRIIRATLDVLRTVAVPDRPVVLVLDDLQWASETAASLLDALLHEEWRPGLLVVAAYRDGEIGDGHPMATMLPRWRRLPVPPVIIEPQNLTGHDLGSMIAQMLRVPPHAAMRLAGTVRAHTAGNPFDTVALLNTLRSDGLLVRTPGGWDWDEEVIGRHVGDTGVVDLIATRVERLPASTATLLREMACLGGEVDTELLSVVGDVAPADIPGRLAPAVADGLLSVEHQAGRAGALVVRFRHDRVQQAATSGLGPAALRAMHLTLARRLAPWQRYAGIAAEQYLGVAGEVSAPQEQHRVVDLFRAAARALRLVDPVMTERYLAAALDLLERVEPDPAGPAASAQPAGAGGGGWEPAEYRRLRIDVEIGYHSALFQLGRLADADGTYRAIERLQPATLALVGPACERISSLTFRDCPHEAVAVGLDLLRRLGVRVPDGAQLRPWTAQGFARFRAWAEQDGVAEDLSLPEVSDPQAAAAASLMSRMIPPAFFVGMPIVPWLVFECQRLWADHGPSASLVGPISHAGFVSVLYGQDHRTGYRAARRVLTVCAVHGHEPETSHARLILSLSAAHWFEPLETVVGHARHALDGLIRGGDLQNAGFAAYVLIPAPLECTPSLEEYLIQVEARLAFATDSGNDQTFAALVGYRQLARSLLGRTAAPASLDDATFDTGAHLARYADNPVASAYARLVLGILAAVHGDHAALDEHSAAAMELLPVYEATLSTAVVRVLRGLALAGTLRGRRQLPPGRADAAGDELAGYARWLAERAQDAPGNFEHLQYLVEAELAWATGSPMQAASAFDAAVRTVLGRQRPWHAALIVERAAVFHLAHGMEHSGHALLAQARGLYQAWGAVAKVRAMERAPTTGAIATAAGRPPLASEAIDLMAILRACQALSSETGLDGLYQRVREVLSAVTGATHVRIVLRRDEPAGWFVPTADTGGGDGPGTAVDGPDGGRLVPLPALRYTERTMEPLVVDDVACDPRFATDPYLRRRRCRSLLVVPILSHGAVRAMLILEHRLASLAFTADRLDAVRLIVGQLAVSLENAIVYEELEERVRQRTAQLRAAQSELIDRARHVGMAEIATNVLHNVGNVLTSVNVSAGLVARQIRASRLDGLARAVALLREREHDPDAHPGDDHGRLLAEYLVKACDAVVAERRVATEELDRLTTNIDHIVDIVATQQTHASGVRLNEPVAVELLVEDAIRINAEALERHRVTVVRHLAPLPNLLLDKVRLLLILVNLINNAKQAMAQLADRPRVVTVYTEMPDPATLRIRVEDVGEGIRPEHLARIFTHGFTTRDDGHGFGLHSCALAAGEMGGTLLAHSDGPGRGASFVLELPVTAEGGRC